MARHPALVPGLAMKAAGEEQAWNQEPSPGLKRRDENYGTSIAERASRGVALAVSGCEMPSRILALGNGYSAERPELLSYLCLWQQLRTAPPPGHARRQQQWGCLLWRPCGRGFAPGEAILSRCPKRNEFLRTYQSQR